MKTSFNSVALIGAALASVMVCYTISLKVSAERAGVDAVRGRIAGDLRDIRLLQAELRTRARLPELQRWNEQVLALAPPRAEQFVGSAVMLASFEVAPAAPAIVAPVVRLAAVDRRPAVAPMAAPSPIRTIAYAVPALDGGPAASQARAKGVAAQSRPRTGTVPGNSADGPGDLGLDAALGGAIAAAAAAERAGFARVALR